jgi:hypothetical protein
METIASRMPLTFCTDVEDPLLPKELYKPPPSRISFTPNSCGSAVKYVTNRPLCKKSSKFKNLEVEFLSICRCGSAICEVIWQTYTQFWKIEKSPSLSPYETASDRATKLDFHRIRAPSVPHIHPQSCYLHFNTCAIRSQYASRRHTQH